MSNVKPGDIARVVVSDDGNIGKQVFVVEFESRRDSGIWWVVEILEPGWAWTGWTLVRAEAGQRVAAADQDLRRIDPPADEASDTVVRERETTT